MKRQYMTVLSVLGLALALVIPAVVLAQPRAQPPIPHGYLGGCTVCHLVGGPGVGVQGGAGLPADHQGRTNAICTTCHQEASAVAAAQPTPAPFRAAATPTSTPAKPVAAPASPTLPRTGGFPVVPVALGGGAFLAGLGWILRRVQL